MEIIKSFYPFEKEFLKSETKLYLFFDLYMVQLYRLAI